MTKRRSNYDDDFSLEEEEEMLDDSILHYFPFLLRTQQAYEELMPIGRNKKGKKRRKNARKERKTVESDVCNKFISSPRRQSRCVKTFFRLHNHSAREGN